MKKTIICILMILFTFTLLNSYELDIIKGEDNIEKVIKSKPISVILTMNNTMHIKETYDNWLKQYNAKQREEGKKELNKEEMIKGMRKKIAQGLKSDGMRWKLKLIENKDEAKDGYILHINIDQIRPIPMATYTGKYSITAYKVGSDEELFKVKINDRLFTKVGFGVTIIGLPGDSLKDFALLLIQSLPRFLRRGKKSED